VRLLLVLLLSALLAVASEPPRPGSSPANATAATILVYHRFGPVAVGATMVRTSVFERQLEFLRANEYTVVPLRDVVNFVMGRGSLPARAVSITADDGHRTVFTEMKPLVQRCRTAANAPVSRPSVSAPGCRPFATTPSTAGRIASPKSPPRSRLRRILAPMAGCYGTRAMSTLPVTPKPALPSAGLPAASDATVVVSVALFRVWLPARYAQARKRSDQPRPEILRVTGAPPPAVIGLRCSRRSPA
jgi:hypothetical protein